MQLCIWNCPQHQCLVGILLSHAFHVAGFGMCHVGVSSRHWMALGSACRIGLPSGYPYPPMLYTCSVHSVRKAHSSFSPLGMQETFGLQIPCSEVGGCMSVQ